MFGKRKKEAELKAKQELEQKRIEEEKLREERLREEMEAERRRAAEQAAKIVPYKFSVPDPKPKELISVLTEMLKKLFPETKKAYLVLTELEDKKGYLLVVDIDAKFYKIIHMYLDGETKKVRGGLPIECILYSKSGNLTDEMEPFYKKSAFENKSGLQKPVQTDEVKFSAMPEYGFGEIAAELKKEYEESVTEPVVEDDREDSDEKAADEVVDEAVEECGEEAAEKDEEKTTPVKVVPETKQQLFVMMNRMGLSPTDEAIELARDGFGEFEFFIPFTSDEKSEEIQSSFGSDARPVLLINRDNGIKAIVFFTDKEDAEAFSKRADCSIAKVKYKDYKQALADETLAHAAAEGIIINPDSEQILLAPDYCLL